jgi:hypothetical protein
VALGAALLSLLRYERARAAQRLPFAAAGLAGLASWVHPWQGEVLILSLVGGEAVMWALGRRRPRVGSLGLVVGAAALPLAYYYLLHRFDPSWRMAATADDSGLRLSHIASWLWPLLIPALLAYRLRPRHLTDAVVRVWPVAALTCYLVNLHAGGNSPVHAFLGITVPLAILAAQGLQSITWPRGIPRAALAVLAVAAVTLPGTIQQLTRASRVVPPSSHQANFMPDGDADALHYLADQPGPGGVLTESHLGAAVPAETGRQTYIGDQYWSQPDFRHKEKLVDDLMLRWITPQRARALVLSTGARYVIDDCWAHKSLTRLLGPIIQSSHQFDCARVYTIKPKPRPGHPTPA